MTTYAFVALPLDSSSASQKPASFDLSVLSTIEFASGPISASNIAEAVRRHPLLSLNEAVPLRGLAMRLQDWMQGPKTLVLGAPGVLSLELRYSGKTAFSTLRNTLLDYLARDKAVTVAKLRPDDTHDRREADHFFDPAGMFDRVLVLREMLQQRFAGGMMPIAQASDLTDRSLNFQRRRASASHAQSALIQLLSGELKSQDVGISVEGAKALAQLRLDVTAVERRLRPRSDSGSGSDALQSFAAGSEGIVDVLDPNASIHAALVNGLLAKACGLVTEWSAQSPDPMVGDFVIAVDPSSFADPSSATCRTTAFRRSDMTSPVSYADIGTARTTNCGLVALNDDKNRPRYSCTGINAEVSAIQAVVLQAKNSISNSALDRSASPKAEPMRDDRPPVELADQQFGANDLEAVGLTISAPVEDLVTPDALKTPNREADLPCLFLEDLWIGFRLDIADANGGGVMRSVHRQRQRIKFSGSGNIIAGETEDFWPRESPARDVRDLSNEIVRFNGLSAAQNIDYAKMLGDYKPPASPAGAPFSVTVDGSVGVTPLRFNSDYFYRLRTVLQGAISFRSDDAGLAQAGPAFHQLAPFRRARSFRPGEVVPLGEGAADEKENGLSIFLSDRQRKRSVLIAPSPVDPDTARYGGQFLARSDEPSVDRKRIFVKDLPQLLSSVGDTSYYCDPDVSGVKVELWIRNGDRRTSNPEYRYANGVFCELIEPKHMGPEVGLFGREGNWREFRPIELTFSTTSSADARLSSSSGGRKVRIEVPRYADVEVVLTPIVSVEAVRRSAAFVPSTTIAPLLSSPSAVAALPVVEHRIRVVHCVAQPAAQPRIVSESDAGASSSELTAILKREPKSDRAELVGYVEVDAASTGEMQLNASWLDIDDDPMHERYVLKAGQTSTKPRSISFKEAHGAAAGLLPSPLQKDFATRVKAFSDAADVIGKQCAENRIFLGGLTPNGSDNDGLAPVDLAFGTARRARPTLVATVKSRYASRFPLAPEKDVTLASNSIVADVPASMPLPVPNISHVTPLVRQRTSSEKTRRTRTAIYGFRIYVRRPWFVSGPGERLAIACHAGPLPKRGRDVIDKGFTQWGQDPSARSPAEAGQRLPRASDFRATDGQEPLDAALYPKDSREGIDPVLYADDVVRDAENGTIDDSRLALASYALRWDDDQSLWYCDVVLGSDFTGWIGLALYRHQPHAHEGYQLSTGAAFVYARVLQSETVAWLRQDGRLRVTIGPIFDSTMSFEAESRAFHNGVSMSQQGQDRLSFRELTVDGRRYFEGTFNAGKDGIEIFRRRLGRDISSFNIR